MENLSSINVVSAHTQDRGNCNLPPRASAKRIHIYANEIQKKTRKSLDALEYQYMWKLHSWNSSVREIFPFDRARRRCSIEGAYFGLGTHGSAARWPMRLSQFFFRLSLSSLYHSAVQLMQKRSTSSGGGEVIGKVEIMSSESCVIVPIARLDIRVAYKWRFFGPFGGEWRCTALEIDILIRNSHFHISLNIKHKTICLGQQQRMHADISY